jgi:hypothetical protein
MREIRDFELAHWREHGFVILENLLDADELEGAIENIGLYMPSWEEYERAPQRYRALLETSNYWPVKAFPFDGDALNTVCTNPVLVSLARMLTGAEQVALSHSRLRGKYAGAGWHEQDLHVDFWNNTVVYPPPDDAIVDVPLIIFYTEVTLELGPTYVVSQQHTRGSTLVPIYRSRREFPDLYTHEIPVVVPAGSALLYSMRTFHRGSALRARTGVRFSHHMSLKRADTRWAGQVTFQHDAGTPEMNRFLVHATPEQRNLVGFPLPGDSYWTKETLTGVAARYPDMDMEAYWEAFRASSGSPG